MMQLPGEKPDNEFAMILPFSPANRNNMIGWMAGRCDGENYGKLAGLQLSQIKIDRRTGADRSTDRSECRPLRQVHALESARLARPTRSSAGHSNRPLTALRRTQFICRRPAAAQCLNCDWSCLAIQDKVGYGKSFEEAMTNLFGETTKPTGQTPVEAAKGNKGRAAQSSCPELHLRTFRTQLIIGPFRNLRITNGSRLKASWAKPGKSSNNTNARSRN